MRFFTRKHTFYLHFCSMSYFTTSRPHKKLSQTEAEADDTDSSDINTSDSESFAIDTTKNGYFETSAPRQRQTKKELPLVTYCKRWKCCFFCRGQKVYDSLLDDNSSSTDDSKEQTVSEKAQGLPFHIFS